MITLTYTPSQMPTVHHNTLNRNKVVLVATPFYFVFLIITNVALEGAVSAFHKQVSFFASLFTMPSL